VRGFWIRAPDDRSGETMAIAYARIRGADYPTSTQNESPSIGIGHALIRINIFDLMRDAMKGCFSGIFELRAEWCVAFVGKAERYHLYISILVYLVFVPEFKYYI
jgi:hypothetical protein